MKKIISLILVFVTMVCLASCKGDIDTSSKNSTSSNTDTSVENSNDKLDTKDEPSVKNIELNTTSTNEKYYSTLQAGRYLGTDLPNDIGCYYKEITSFDDFSALVEHPNVIDETIFQDNFILVIKRVTGGYFSDIGFKNYDFHLKEIELDSFPISEGTDDVKTKFDYIILSKYKAQMDEDNCLLGDLTIKESIKNYYGISSMQKATNNEAKFGLFFKDLESANVYLASKGYNEIINYGLNDTSILLLCVNFQLEGYESSEKSCYLGFKDFNTNGNDIYITLERSIVNTDYGNKNENEILCISIPNSLICNTIVENPSIHILVQDNIIELIDN